MSTRRTVFRAALVAGVIAWATTTATTAWAAIYSVSSIPDLQACIDAAQPGDIIIVRRGVYTTSASITVGSDKAPRAIRSGSSRNGRAPPEITGTHGFNVVSPATHVQIVGFKFTHQSGRNQVRNGATHIRFTRSTRSNARATAPISPSPATTRNSTSTNSATRAPSAT